MSTDKRVARLLLVMLFSFAGLVAALDLYEVVTGQADLNRHVPFLLPAVVLILAGILYATERLYDRLDALRDGRPPFPPPDRDLGD